MKSLLNIKMPVVTFAEMQLRVDAGAQVKPAYLYEPEHAPKGTKFVMVVFTNGEKRPYRIVKEGYVQ
jgi:hypothetical protein